MKIVQINLSCTWGSTGKICDSISKLLTEKNIENYIFYTYGDNPNKNSNYILYGNLMYEKTQALKSRIFGNYGFNSVLGTYWLIDKIEKINPDIVHIHNIHSHDCHFEKLFQYLKKKKIKIYYTFHDCWAFTGYCPHFAMEKCGNWKSGCGNCKLRKRYSWFLDKSRKNLVRKKNSLQETDLTIITPSQWLADLVKQSYLKEHPIKVINNGIALDIFKPTPSDFREKYDLVNKKIILGVSFVWGKSKGLDIFIDLAKRMSEEYKIILVGTNKQLDKKLPDNILSIHRTHSQKELAEIYTVADVFVNPTREDTYPTVNMESLACGTPVLTFRTGGSPEILDENCGSVVECDDVEALENEIVRICMDSPYSVESCVFKAKKFDRNEKFKEYINLYEGINIAGT